MKNILLSGSTGFVGQNLVQYFYERALVAVQPINLREPLADKLPLSDAVIHLAGKAHDTKNTTKSHVYFDVNYGLTKELFDRFLASSTNDFIYFSSVKVVTETVKGKLTEDAEPHPATAYGQSKLQAEQYLLSQKLPKGKRLFILRPCMIHGPGNKGNLNLLYKVVKSGVPYPLGAFNNRRSFLSIENLLFILNRIVMDPSIPGGIYHLADDESLSTIELIRIIATTSKTKAKIWTISPGFIEGLARIGDKLRLPLNSERLKKLTESYEVSNEKIKNALAITELPVKAKEGLAETIKSFQLL